MFYCIEYNSDNAEICRQKIESMDDLELCYLDDPAEPVLMCKTRIHSNPLKYHSYQCNLSLPETEETYGNDIKLKTKAQVVQFLNAVYNSRDPSNSEVYTRQDVTMKQILNVVWRYTNLYDDKSLFSFAKWCNHQQLDFLNASTKRRKSDSGDRQSVRSLFVLKSSYHPDVVKNIPTVLPRHQNEIQELKAAHYTVIGYARKSNTPDTLENRVGLLRSMCAHLKERSLVDEVYVSACYQASDPIIHRDQQKHPALEQLNDATGDMQDMLTYIADKEKVCLVILDHPGLTANCQDLEKFLR